MHKPLSVYDIAEKTCTLYDTVLQIWDAEDKAELVQSEYSSERALPQKVNFSGNQEFYNEKNSTIASGNAHDFYPWHCHQWNEKQ